MFSGIAVILAIAWLFGLVNRYTLGGYVHLLLGLAVALFVVDIISRRRHLVP